MTVYDFPRLKNTIVLGTAILLSLLGTNAVLVLTSAAFPDWLPRQFLGVDFLVDNRERVQGAAAQFRDGVVGADNPLVVILGLSSASEGVSLIDLNDRLDDDVRVLGLSGAGRNMRDVERYARPLIDSGPRPVLIVFAINLFHLIDPSSPAEGFMANIRKPDTADDLRGWWILRRRQDLKYAFDFGVDGVKISLYQHFDVYLGDSADPWRETVRLGLPQMADQAQWQDNIQRYGERGYFDIKSYQRSTAQVSIFLDLIGAFVDQGTNTVVVLMPEHSLLRSRIPATALDSLMLPLDKRFNGSAPAMFDLRSSIPDSGFSDISHMNQDGRDAFSSGFARIIAEQLPGTN